MYTKRKKFTLSIFALIAIVAGLNFGQGIAMAQSASVALQTTPGVDNVAYSLKFNAGAIEYLAAHKDFYFSAELYTSPLLGTKTKIGSTKIIPDKLGYFNGTFEKLEKKDYEISVISYSATNTIDTIWVNGAFTVGSAAQATAGLDTPQITFSDTSGLAQVTIHGSFNAVTGKIIGSVSGSSLDVLYGHGGTATDAPPPINSLKKVYCVVSVGTGGVDNCQLNFNKDSSGTFTVTLVNLQGGDYVAIPYFDADGTLSPIGNSTGITFSIKPTTTTFVLNPPIINGMTANITVIGSNIPDAGRTYYLELGEAVPSTTGASNFVCTLDTDLLSPDPGILAGGVNGNTINYTFTLKNPGAYCVGIKQKPIPISTPPGVPPYFPNSLFAVGGYVLPDTATVNPNANKIGCVAGDGNSGYCLLAPLPGIGDKETGYLNVTTGMGTYINGIIRLVLGLIGILSVIMIIVGGIEYMSTVSLGEKEGAKSRITNALFGLILALASYIILNTINPKLVNLNIGIPNAQITFSAIGGDGVAEDDTSGITYKNNAGTDAVVGGFNLQNGATFDNPGISSETKSFVEKLKSGTTISQIVVYAVSHKAFFYYKDSTGTQVRGTVVPIGIGANGYSQPGTAVVGDKKTPLTSNTTPWYIDSNIRFAKSTSEAVLCHGPSGKLFNCGAAFIEFDAKNTNGGLKNTGFHGNHADTTASTAGCIRMLNDDLIALGHFMTQGTIVYILEK